MANSLTISLDPNNLAEKLDGETLTTALKPFIKVASKISADHICADAKARLERQLSGTSTGETLEGIEVRSDRTGWGWIVDATNASKPMLDRWLEWGTKHMHARPFFFDAARLEQDAHNSRIHNAIDASLSQYGLGEYQAR